MADECRVVKGLLDSLWGAAIVRNPSDTLFTAMLEPFVQHEPPYEANHYTQDARAFISFALAMRTMGGFMYSLEMREATTSFFRPAKGENVPSTEEALRSGYAEFWLDGLLQKQLSNMTSLSQFSPLKTDRGRLARMLQEAKSMAVALEVGADDRFEVGRTLGEILLLARVSMKECVDCIQKLLEVTDENWNGLVDDYDNFTDLVIRQRWK